MYKVSAFTKGLLGPQLIYHVYKKDFSANAPLQFIFHNLCTLHKANIYFYKCFMWKICQFLYVKVPKFTVYVQTFNVHIFAHFVFGFKLWNNNPYYHRLSTRLTVKYCHKTQNLMHKYFSWGSSLTAKSSVTYPSSTNRNLSYC